MLIVIWYNLTKLELSYINPVIRVSDTSGADLSIFKASLEPKVILDKTWDSHN
jgi:hypothetical protein